MKPRHLLDVDDVSRDEIRYLLDRAEALKAKIMVKIERLEERLLGAD